MGVPHDCNVVPDDPNSSVHGAHSFHHSDGTQELLIGEAVQDELAVEVLASYTGVVEADMLNFINQRTFLCVAPQLTSSKSVIQSTTEATNELSTFHYAYRRGLNPRRLMAPDV